MNKTVKRVLILLGVGALVIVVGIMLSDVPTDSQSWTYDPDCDERWDVAHTGSMEPVLQGGDEVCLDTNITPEDLHRCDIIVFRVPSEYIVHRIVAKENREGKWRYWTRGDFQPTDPSPVPFANVKGKVVNAHRDEGSKARKLCEQTE